MKGSICLRLQVFVRLGRGLDQCHYEIHHALLAKIRLAGYLVGKSTRLVGGTEDIAQGHPERKSSSTPALLV